MKATPGWYIAYFGFLTHWGLNVLTYATEIRSPTTVIIGQITDCQTQKPILTQITWGNQSLFTQLDGRFTLFNIPCARNYTMHITAVGYQPKDTSVFVPCQDTFFLKLCLSRTARALSPVVVSATRTALPVEAVPSSVSVITKEEIRAQPVLTPEELLQLRSGLQVTMRQLSVRGTSGWAYGVGSRVLVVLDDLPLMTPEAGDVRWFLFPEAVIDRIEVVKGASSTLWGAGAMDGVLLLRLREPKPGFHIETYAHGGWWDQPPKPYTHWQWWQPRRPPRFWKSGVFVGGGSTHLGGWLLAEATDYQYYRSGEQYRRQRLSGRITFRHAPWKASLTTHFVQSDQNDFFYWANWDSAYVPFPGTLIASQLTQTIIDGRLLRLHTPHSQKLAIRLFWAERNRARHFAGLTDYQSHFHWSLPSGNTEIFLGIQGVWAQVDSAEFFQRRHQETGISPYLQFVHEFGAQGQTPKSSKEQEVSPDRRFPIWRVFAGIRLPWRQIDTLTPLKEPIFRMGVNTQLTPGTFVRFSIGEGVRYPTVAERFTSYRIGAIYLLPNPEIQVERGWSADLGVRQLFQWDNHLQGFIDLSIFWTEFQDLIEYTFGIWQVQGQWIAGFRAENTGQARVAGCEVESGWQLNFARHHLTFYGGILWVDPRDLTYDPATATTDTFLNPYLKYRFRTLVRAQLTWRWQFLTLGIQYQYQSPLLRIDPIFVLLIPDFLTVYRMYPFHREQWNAYLQIRWRHLTFAFWVYNLTNRLYIVLPGNVGPPRRYVFQVRWTWNTKPKHNPADPSH